MRKLWRETKLEEVSWPLAVAWEALSKAHLATSHLSALDTMDGWTHGPYFIESAKCTKQGREKRNSHRGLMLMTLGDKG